MKNILLLCLGLLFLSAQQADRKTSNHVDADPLFDVEEALELTLKTDIDALFKDRGDVRDYHPAHVRYKNSAGEMVEVPLKVKVRGNYRRKGGVCKIPPIRLNFAKTTAEGSIFEGQDKIKLVTHCQRNPPKYAQYLLQEYLIYRVYNQVSDYSFKTRLVKIRYEDESGKWKPMDTYAFIIEDQGKMAERLGGKIKEGYMVHPTDCHAYQTTLMSVFAYLMGNTDWSIVQQHNVKLLDREGEMIVPIPYDFDWSGMVNAPYAIPNPAIFENLPNVRTRIYRGFEREESLFVQVFETFKQHKEAIYAIYNDFGPLDKNQKKLSIKYLDSFYKTINDPKLARKNIINRAR
ncbi:MAG: hypothetical protein AAF696_02250 [Bacteroidota bacterium]